MSRSLPQRPVVLAWGLKSILLLRGCRLKTRDRSLPCYLTPNHMEMEWITAMRYARISAPEMKSASRVQSLVDYVSLTPRFCHRKRYEFVSSG